jgi:hypothetical protein
LLECMEVGNGWCGLCYENRRGRANHKHHWGYRPMRLDTSGGLEAVLKKRDAGPAGVGWKGELSPGKWGTLYPSIWEMLTTAAWPDGSPRTLSTLTIFVEDGQIKLCLNDRDQGLTGWASAGNVEEALKAMEAALKEDRMEWRRAKEKPMKKR